jgi:trehalose 6-phosphate synthase
VAAQDPVDPGVLILSPLAGAARELSGAIQVNPYDTKGLGHAIQAALAMPLAERRERHASMLEIVRRNDVRAWHERFIEALERGAAPSVANWEDHAFQKAAPLD